MCLLQLQALESLGVVESLVVGASAFHAELFLPSYEASLQLQAYPDVMCTTIGGVDGSEVAFLQFHMTMICPPDCKPL